MGIEQKILDFEKELLTEKDIEQLGLFSASTLRNERSKNRIPRLPYIKLGRSVFYQKEDVLTYIRKNIVRSNGN